MKSYEAIGRAIGHQATEFAKRLGLSTSMIYKWTEPCNDYSTSGALNPVDRLETVIETALRITPNCRGERDRSGT